MRARAAEEEEARQAEELRECEVLVARTGGGGARPVPAAGRPDKPLHPPRPYLPLVLGQAGGFEEEGEEKEEEEDKEKAGVPVQLLFMTSYDSLFPTCTDEKHCRQGKPL